MASGIAIALGLAVVVLIYLIIGDDAPAVRREIPALWSNATIFAGFALVGIASFYGQVAGKSWWRTAVAAQVLALGGLVLYYWP